MLEVEIKFPKIRLDHDHVNREAAMLADANLATMVNHVKLSLVSFGKIATGGTLHGVQGRSVSDHRLAMFGVAATGIWKRQVIAPHAYKFIQSGRRAGARMPPMQALVPWFNALGIPRDRWFPILRAISIRGIQPRDVSGRAIREAQPALARNLQHATGRIARGIVKVQNAA
jgi:hypothetical protein